jgi:hypothetical protein
MKQFMKRSIATKAIGLSVALLIVFALMWQRSRVTRAAGPSISLTTLAGGFNNPIGVDFYEPTGELIASANYPTGETNNLDLVHANGTHTPYSSLHGLTNELKIATVRSGGCQGGFQVGDLFTGNGVPGQIVKVSSGGATVTNPWATLPGETALVRGSLYQDRACDFGGDLIVVTGNEQTDFPGAGNFGNVWRVTSAGVPTLIAVIGHHLEGVITVPNDPTRYGPAAGRILAGAEDLDVSIPGQLSYGHHGRIYAIGPSPNVNGNVFTIGDPDPNFAVNYPLAGGAEVHAEDIDLIRKDSQFFGVAFADGKILTAQATDFDPFCGNILITQELPSGHFPPVSAPGKSGLFILSFNAVNNNFETTEFESGGVVIQQWEHVTFLTGTDCGGVSHGCTPGFWKTHATNPPWGSFTPSQKVKTVFTIPGCIPSKTTFENESLLDALQGGGGSGLDGKTKILLRAATAAVLNADNGNPPYPLSVPQIISQTNAALASCDQTTITNLADRLDAFNNRCDTR